MEKSQTRQTRQTRQIRSIFFWKISKHTEHVKHIAFIFLLEKKSQTRKHVKHAKHGHYIFEKKSRHTKHIRHGPQFFGGDMLNTLNTSNTSDTLIIKILFRENLKHANTSNTSNTYTTFFLGHPLFLPYLGQLRRAVTRHEIIINYMSHTYSESPGRALSHGATQFMSYICKKISKSRFRDPSEQGFLRFSELGSPDYIVKTTIFSV